jgi:hypothetical protein
LVSLLTATNVIYVRSDVPAAAKGDCRSFGQRRAIVGFGLIALPMAGVVLAVRGARRNRDAQPVDALVADA